MNWQLTFNKQIVCWEVPRGIGSDNSLGLESDDSGCHLAGEYKNAGFKTSAFKTLNVYWFLRSQSQRSHKLRSLRAQIESQHLFYYGLYLFMQELESININDVIPAVEITNKHYSLEPDMINGQFHIIRWTPKSKFQGPIPLNFDYPLTDQFLEKKFFSQSTEKKKVLYLGPRYQSSLKMHERLAKSYKYNYCFLYQQPSSKIKAFYKRFYCHFQSKVKRQFSGSNPQVNFDKELEFDSGFQSGNLDAVIKNNEHYDLYLRIDSNTRGHLIWYYFSVKNNYKLGKAKFSICNLKKTKSLYTRNMTPYFRERRGRRWTQWEQLKDKTNFQTSSYVSLKKQQQSLTSQKSLSRINFAYDFLEINTELQFAYCPPYTYSHLIRYLKQVELEEKLVPINSRFLTKGTLCQSLSGVEIPLLQITNPMVNNKNKKLVLISGRIHPGQSNSSHVMQGFIQFLLSKNELSAELCSRAIFKIVPMINPDGVIVGNFRVSLSGLDLNREFLSDCDALIPEVSRFLKLAQSLKCEYKDKMKMFLDFHGHSVRKNVFFYGPEYSIYEKMYYKSRILAKLISNITPMFRYYSCNYRITPGKKSTGRAVLLKKVPYSYTIQASNSSYYDSVDKKEYAFDQSKWRKMGTFLGIGLCEFLEMESEDEMLKEKKKKEKKKVSKSKERNIKIEKAIRNDQGMTEKTKRVIMEILKQEQKYQKKEEEDNISEGKSDSQNLSDDLSTIQLLKYHQQIMNFLIEFKRIQGRKTLNENIFTKKIKQTLTKNANKKLNKRRNHLLQSQRYKNLQTCSKKKFSVHDYQQSINSPKICYQRSIENNRTSREKSGSLIFKLTRLTRLPKISPIF